jgi:23S rRNA (cytosine1962-C5)-methyltransferase
VRLVHGESDGLPGVVVDQYGGVVVLQCLSAGAEFWRQAIGGRHWWICCKPACIVERSDVDVRTLEGLDQRVGVPVRSGAARAPGDLRARAALRRDVLKGQKTGFYIDQRRNRQRVRELVRGRSVLNCFSYTGLSVYMPCRAAPARCCRSTLRGMPCIGALRMWR